MPRNLAKVFRFHGPFRGLNDNADRRQLDSSWAAELNDVVIRAGAIESRPGYTVTNTTRVIQVAGFYDQFTRTDRGIPGGNWVPDAGGGTEAEKLFRVSGNQLLGPANTSLALTRHLFEVPLNITIDYDVLGPDTPTADTADAEVRCVAVIGTKGDEILLQVQKEDTVVPTVSLGFILGGTGTGTVSDTLASWDATTSLRLVVAADGTTATATAYFGAALGDSLSVAKPFTFESCTPFISLSSEAAKTAVIASYGFDNIKFDYDATAGRIYGMYHAKVDNAPTLFIRSQRGMHKLSGADFAQLHGNLTVDALPSFAVANDALYAADQLSSMFRYDTTQGLLVGMDPVVLNSLTTAGSGTKTGTYDYCITVIDSATAYESNPSNTTQIECTTEDVNVLLAAHAHPQVDQMGVYRRKVSDGETVYRLVTTATFAGTWADTVADADIVGTELSENNDNLPGTAELVCWHENRMYYKLSEFPTRVYYSEPDLPESVPADQWNDIGGSAGYEVKAIVPAFGELVMFTDNSIVVMIGDADGTGSFITAVPGTGCIAHGSVVAIGNFVYFADENGVYRFDGQRAVLMSEAIRGTWATLDSAQFKWMTATNDQHRKLYLLSARTSGASENDIVLVYHYGEETAAAPGPWTKWDLEATCWARSDAPDVLYFGRADGTVGVLGGWDDLAAKDSGVGISWQWKGARSDFGMPAQYKRFTYCTPLVAKSDVTGASMATGWLLEDDSSVAGADVLDRTIARARPIHVGRYAQQFGIYFAASGTPALTRILGFELDMGVIGRR